jgi:hypothetical protein
LEPSKPKSGNLHSKKFCVYVYWDGGIPVYVGKGRASRPWKHLKKSHNKRLGQFIAQCDENSINVVIKVVLRTHDEFEAFVHERALIKFFGRLDKGEGTLFNRNDGVGRGLFKGVGNVVERLQQRFQVKIAGFEKKSDWITDQQKKFAIRRWMRMRGIGLGHPDTLDTSWKDLEKKRLMAVEAKIEKQRQARQQILQSDQ